MDGWLGICNTYSVNSYENKLDSKNDHFGSGSVVKSHHKFMLASYMKQIGKFLLFSEHDLKDLGPWIAKLFTSRNI